MDNDPYRPYPWWTRVWPLGRMYFAGWQRGEEAGIARGRFQMGDTQAFPPDSGSDQ
jgi:hypothetical protein